MMNKNIIAIGPAVDFCSLTSAATWTSFTNTDAVRQVIFGNDRIWGATSGGVVQSMLHRGQSTGYTNTDGIGGIDYRCVEVDTSQNLWFGTGDGWLSRISVDGNIRNFAFRDSSGIIARPLTLYDLKRDGDILWVASDLGISKFLIYSNGGEIRDTGRQLGNLQSGEDAICVDVIGENLWVGTAQGIAFIDKNNPNIQFLVIGVHIQPDLMVWAAGILEP